MPLVLIRLVRTGGAPPLQHPHQLSPGYPAMPRGESDDFDFLILYPPIDRSSMNTEEVCHLIGTEEAFIGDLGHNSS